MQDNMEYIDQYFTGTPTPEQVKEFERRIEGDVLFAEDLAFYLATKKAISNQSADEKKRRFRQVYLQTGSAETQQNKTVVYKLWPYAAAAAIIGGLILSWFLFVKAPSSQQMAQQYITANLQTLGVTMGTRENELQAGLRLYNDGNLKEAFQQFEKLANLDSTDLAAKKYAGIAALRLQHYDKALHYFKLLKDQPGLYANPGAFLQATTLLKRNLPDDKQTAKQLLEQVVSEDLEGKEIAEQWLKKW